MSIPSGFGALPERVKRSKRTAYRGTSTPATRIRIPHKPGTIYRPVCGGIDHTHGIAQFGVYAERVPFVGREFICPAMRSNTSFNSARVGTWK